MDLSAISTFVFAPILALMGYQQHQINKLQDKANAVLDEQQVKELVEYTAEILKEKIEDNLGPINARLDRMDNKLERILDKH